MSFTSESGRRFGQQRPPLSVIIKQILERYPDGQIFKEMIQNADDAGAKTVWFYVDERQHGTSNLPHPHLARFQGPALVAANDACFKGEDWKGIQKLQQSVKAEDPFKVGRFGIGFNSVYHITDLPVLVSGTDVGILDPQEELWRDNSGKLFELSELQGSDITNALHGIASFNRDSLNYPHTIFRLPLRTKQSSLSRNIYSIDKVKQLLDALKLEAKYLLLFLKSVAKIEVIYIDKHSGRHKQTFCVAIDLANMNEINSERSRFLAQLHELHTSSSCHVSNILLSQVTFQIKITDERRSDTTQWVVVTQVGSSNTETLRTAEELHIFPWVGVAVQISPAPITDNGRVFCFLPLPPEVTSGLPVHVNGTFSLNDERRTLKWIGAERTNDNMARWNDLLITDLLPRCYFQLLMQLRDKHGHEQFYRSWPDPLKLHRSHWHGCLQNLYQLLFANECIWSTESRCWVSVKNKKAIFIEQGGQLNSVVTRVLTKRGFVVVRAPDIIWRAIQFSRVTVNIVTPSLTRRAIRSDKATYETELAGGKLELLRFCLSDNDFSDLNNIALVPLATGEFTTFTSPSQWATNLYVCSREYPRILVPNQDNLLIDLSDTFLQSTLISLAQSGQTQLKPLDAERVASLLPNSFPLKWRARDLATVSLPCNGFPTEWFETFWKWVQPHSLSHFKELFVLPIATRSTKDGFYVTKLMQSQQSSVLVVRENCPKEKLTALSKLRVNCTMTKHTPYVKHLELIGYVHESNPTGILTAISNARVNPSKVTFSEEEAMCLQQFLAVSRVLTLSPSQRTVLSNLSIFKTHNNSQLTSISIANSTSWNNQATLEPHEFQLTAASLPDTLVIFSRSKNYSCLFNYSAMATPNTTAELIQTKVFPMIQAARVSHSKMDALMTEIIQLLPVLKTQSSRIIDMIRELCFLPTLSGQRKPPTALFDPLNKQLQNLFDGEDVFPLPPFNKGEYIIPLQKCGLQTSVSAQQLFRIFTSTSQERASFPVEVSERLFKRVEAVMDCISSDPILLLKSVSVSSNQHLDHSIRMIADKRSCLPILKHPPPYYHQALSWKGEFSTPHLVAMLPSVVCCTGERLAEISYLVGSVAYIVQIPKTLSSIFPTTLKIDIVLTHFRKVLASSKKLKAEDMDKHLKPLVHTVYAFLNRNLQQFQASIFQYDEEWIWLSKQKKLTKPQLLALEEHPHFSETQLEPYLHVLPEELLPYAPLFQKCGVEKSFTTAQIISVLTTIKNFSSQVASSRKQWLIVTGILEWITNSGKISASSKLTSSSILYVPIETEPETPNPVLEQVEKVVYTDLSYLRSFHGAKNKDCKFIHHRVAHMARALGAKGLSKQLKISEDAFGDVGPHESLITRLKNILKDYQDGLTIIKELLQNADDAEATEVNICYDARSHQTDPSTLLFPGMANCHGPALLVHNNGVFTADDFENIEKLAAATKSGQHLKIGKFGLGFCSVYHLTDIPSFVSRDRLYIFDPTLEYLKEENQDRSRPGKCLLVLEEVVSHSNQLDPYIGLFGFEQGQIYNGTMFRFPFRTEVSELSRIKYRGVHVEQLMSDVEAAGSKLLLFLQHVNHITFSQIEPGQSKPTVLLDICKKNAKKLVSVGDSLSTSTTAASLFSIAITQNGSRSSSDQERWLVATHSSTTVNTSGSNKYEVASVACPIQQKNTNFSVPVSVKGEMFCFLPLSIKTGLPVHVSSNFAVKNDRSGIHSSDEQRKKNEAKWNIALMQSVIPQAYRTLLVALQGMCENKTLGMSANDYKFTSLWPLKKKLRIQNPWDLMIKPTYELIILSKLFYSSNRQKWLMFHEIKVLSPSILCLAHRQSLPECVVNVMESLQYNLVSLPFSYQESLPMKDTSYIINEEEFLNVFFKNFEILRVSLETRNAVLHLLLLKFAETMEYSSKGGHLQYYLTKHKCILCKPDGKIVKLCSEIVDPRAYFARLYDRQESVFPVDSDSELAYAAMKKVGMISDTLPWKMVIERAKSIEVLHKKSKEEALQRVVIILRCVGDNLRRLSEQLPSELMKISFLPVMDPPESYPDFLFWQGKGKNLLSCQEAVYGEGNHRLAGSQAAIVCEKSPTNGGCGAILANVQSALKIRSRPTLTAAVKHLCYIANKYTKLKCEGKKEASYKWIGESTLELFKFFESELGKSNGEPSELVKLQEAACIWTGREFVSPKQVAIKWDKNGPFLFKLPDTLSSKTKLVKALSIQEKFTVNQLLAALDKLWYLHSKDPMNEKSREMKLIEAVVSELDELIPETGLEVGQSCCLPDEKRVMREVCTLVYNDAQWCKLDNECFLVHSSITRKVAGKLGVKFVRAKALESYEASEHHFDGVEFGQHEELTQRIKNILNEYPFDITVIKELLQNADDAKAKKLYFILDKRKHGQQKTLSDGWKDLQGPAVLIWNDMGFSPDDLRGIQKLGLGSKRSKSEAIGQYGIGFNVVYHLTDCPSFITNGNTLCVLDPHLRYVQGASELRPGRMYENLDESFWNNWSDLKAPYLREKLPDCPQEIVTSGSLFRFPLRHKKDLLKKSKIIDSDSKSRLFLRDYPLLTASRMEAYLDDWAPKMKDALIFLNNIIELKFFVIEEHNKINLKFHFTAALEEEALSKRLSMQQKAGMFKVDLNQSPASEFYPLCLSEKVPSKQTEKWLVKRGIGDSMNPKQHWEFLQHVKPNHGLATPMGRSDFKGNVFCFLPLPMHSHLPVHVNGNFILDAARSGLWRPRDLKAKDDKTRWNANIIEAIASSYADFVVTCQSCYVESSYPEAEKIESKYIPYYQVFPYWLSEESYSHGTKHLSHSRFFGREAQSKEEADKEQEPVLAGDEEELDERDTPAGHMNRLARLMYKKLFKQNAKIHIVIKELISEEDKSQLMCLTEWHPLINKKEPSRQVHFWSLSISKKKVAPVLKRVGLHLSVAPIWIKLHFHEVGHPLPEATPTSVFAYYKRFHVQVSQSGRFPCHIKETSFQCVEDFKLFTEFILMKKDSETDLKFPADPWDLPLLLTADNQLTFFRKKAQVIHTAEDYSSLFKNSLDCFLHPSLLNITYARSYFLRPSEKNWSTIQDILHSAIPIALHDIMLVKEVTTIFPLENIKLLWKCLISEDVFSQHFNHILKAWTLLVSTDGQSFSYKTLDQLLPVIPPNKPPLMIHGLNSTQSLMTGTLTYEVYELLSKHGMPVLDTNICDLAECSRFCPEFSNTKAILNNMFHHYKLVDHGTLYTRGVLDTNVTILFKYLAKIHFAQDDMSLTRVKSLPLFRDISGCYKALEKEACLWPGSACIVGSEKWLNEHTTVFLPRDGNWCLLATAEVLRINPISPLQLYTKFIFPTFGKFSQEERIIHLKHIRDTQELFKTAFAVSTNKSLLPATVDEGESANLFMAELMQLPCLPINEVLKPLYEFCDPESKVFKLFPGGLHFPPEDLQDKDWLSFFRKIGMKTCPTQKEFHSYCKKVEEGKHKEIVEASKVLVEHLCLTEEWRNDEKFLTEVSNISFVCAHKAQRLTWIKAPCPAPNIIQQGKKRFHLTTLKGSVVFTVRNSKIVWTMRCLVELPRLHHSTRKRNEVEETNNFLNNIGITLHPKSGDVVSNLCSISKTDFADFGLFHKYQEKLIVKKRDFPLVEVVYEHFLYLQKADAPADLLGRLRNVACIPVCQEGKVADIKKPVLVKPVGVVATHQDNVKHFNPYLNPLPNVFYDVYNSQIAALGVNRQTQLEQVQFALDTIKEHIQAPYDPNTITKLQELLKVLYSFLPSRASNRQVSGLKCPLYLPNKQSILVDTKALLFNDLGLIGDAPFDLSQVNFSFLSLLVRREDEHNEYGFTADDLHLRLPEHVRPQLLSKCSQVQLHEQCKPNSEEQQSEFAMKLRKAFGFPQFAEVVSLVLSRDKEREEEARKFSDHLNVFLEHLRVLTVKDLKVTISLSTVDPPALIGTASTDFHLEKGPEDSGFNLYVEEEVDPLKLGLFEEMSERMSQCVLTMSSSALTGTDTVRIIGTLMRAENVKQIQDHLRKLRINTSNLQLEESIDDFKKPKVGEKVPDGWHKWLDCDINNYFRPQDLAALEVREEHYIYVIVEYKIQKNVVKTSEESDTEENEAVEELDQYQIRVSEDENDTKIVTVVELYKLLNIKEIKQDDGTTEMVLYDAESTSVKMWDSVKGDNLKDIMKDICSDLRRIWKLEDKSEKRKAIKALYFKWHPDKNSHPLATKAFQFLQQQIARLEQGLPLEDPCDDWEKDTSYSQNWTSAYDFSYWDEIVRQRNRAWNQEQRRHRNRSRGRRRGGSGRGDIGSAAMDWTTTISMKPEPNKAKAWFAQANYDQKVMEVLLEKVSCMDDPEPNFSAHVCYLACQVAEKSIKAGMYQVCGLQSDSLGHHKFVGYACALEQERRSQACGLQSLAATLEGYYDKSRYPSAFSPHMAPSTYDYFSPSRAREADMAASQIYEIIRKIIFE